MRSSRSWSKAARQAGDDRLCPALLCLGPGKAGTLYLAWKGKTTDQVFYSAVFDLPNSLAPRDWTPQETVPDTLTSLGPALAATGYDVLAGWHSESSSSIWRSFAENPF
jgi:hypothetical protein